MEETLERNARMVPLSLEDGRQPADNVLSTKKRQPSRKRIIRWTALALVVGIVALLGLGWAADTLGQVIPPGHATDGAATQARALGFDTLTLSVTPAPPRAGQDETLTFTLTDATGAPIEHAQVSVALTMTAMDMTGGSGQAQPVGAGRYRLVGGFSMGGEWALDVSVTAPDQPTLHTSFTLAVRSS